MSEQERIREVLQEVWDSARGTDEAVLEVRTVPLRDTFVALPRRCLRAAVQALRDRLGIWHLSTITGQDTGTAIELLYHLWTGGGGLTLRTTVPRDDARIPTIADLVPGAAFYEREVSEMLHVTFEGHPDPRPLLLPDDWNGGAPLRLDFLPPAEGDEA